MKALAPAKSASCVQAQKADFMRTVLHAFSTFDYGGAQARFVQLANAWGPRYRHLIVSMDGGMQAAHRLAPDVVWEAVSIQNKRGGGLANRSAFRKLLVHHRPDLMLTYNWGAIEWAAANLPQLVPHVHVEDGFGPSEVERQLARRVWARRFLLGLANADLVVPSKRLANLARAWWIPGSRCRYIPNGVHVTDDRPANTAITGPIVVGTVAGLRREKNIARLLTAFARLRPDHNARLLIVGDGPERPALEVLARDLGIEHATEFAGYLAQPSDRLRQMHLFALSSDTEQQPLSLLEAMAEGVPVLATDVGDVSIMLPRSFANFTLCRADDGAFTEALSLMLSRRDRWSEISAAGFLAVKSKFSFESMLEKWAMVMQGQVRQLPEDSL